MPVFTPKPQSSTASWTVLLCHSAVKENFARHSADVFSNLNWGLVCFIVNWSNLWCDIFVLFSPLCSHCAKLMRQRVSECCAVALKRNYSISVQYSLVSYRKLCTIRWFSTFRTTPLPLMYVNCNSSSLLKMQSLCALTFPGRQLSTARVAGSMLGRLLKLRYILLTGAVGGGITLQQVYSLSLRNVLTLITDMEMMHFWCHCSV